MPEPGMGSGGARGGAGMGGGGRSDRDEPGLDVQSQVDSFSSYDLVGNDMEGYNWVRVAPTPKQVSRTSPEESFSAKTIAKPIAKPAAKPTPTRIEFYLDESPAFVEQKKSVPVVESAGSSAPSYSSTKPISASTALSPVAALTGSTLLNPEWNYLGAQGQPMSSAQKAAAQKLAQTSTWGQALKQDVPYKYDKSYTGPAKKGLLGMLKTGGTPATRKAFETFAKLVGPNVAKFAGPLGAAYGTFDTSYNLTKNVLDVAGLTEILKKWGSSLAPANPSNSQLGIIGMYDKLFGEKNPGG